MHRKNTPELWDDFWKPTTKEEDLQTLREEEKSVRWRRIKSIVLQKYGSFEKLKIIEIGGGSGTYALLFALNGSDVSVLDYSNKALERSKVFFERHNVTATLVHMDALKIDTNLLSKYDISMSFGLTEHFKDKDRLRITKSHFDVLRKGGTTFISVPNKWCFPYRLWKFFSEITGNWEFGEEYPYSRRELARIMDKINKKFYFIGSGIFSSFQFIHPLKIIRRFLKTDAKSITRTAREEVGTPFDQYLGYALVLVGSN